MTSMQTLQNEPSRKSLARRRLSLWLGAVFALAMIMGPGPGIYLVNPNSADAESVTTVGSVPVLYLWALLWLAVQIVVLLIAYVRLWGNE